MRIAYFDCFSGISGDMTIGALLDAGMPLDHLQTELKKLPLEGYQLSTRRIERSAIVATKFDVTLEGSDHTHHHHHTETSVEHHHHHDDGVSHSHHEHEDSHNEIHVHSHGLSYREITEIVEHSALSNRVRERAVAIFREIAIAEARIHGTDLEHVHFHEVGAVDSIVDIVSAAIGLEYFNIDKCYSRAVPLGAGGFVRTAHGEMPIPTPATLQILAGYATELGRVHAEMTTPTGAGMIKAMSSGPLEAGLDSLKILSIGYGAGAKEFAEQPNLLRIVIAEIDSAVDGTGPFGEVDQVIQLTTTIDDMSPAIIALCTEHLLDQVALEVYLRAVTMKKGRLGHELILLIEPARLEDALAILAKETTTIGVRVETITRRKAVRNEEYYTHSEFGSVRSKVITQGEQVRVEPETEEVKRIAADFSLPFREVYERLISEMRR